MLVITSQLQQKGLGCGWIAGRDFILFQFMTLPSLLVLRYTLVSIFGYVWRVETLNFMMQVRMIEGTRCGLSVDSSGLDPVAALI
jgi:hypothetical protein